jgi:hypothetical protein
MDLQKDYSDKTGLPRRLSDVLFEWLLLVAPTILEQSLLERPMPFMPQHTTIMLKLQRRFGRF